MLLLPLRADICSAVRGRGAYIAAFGGGVSRRYAHTAHSRAVYAPSPSNINHAAQNTPRAWNEAICHECTVCAYTGRLTQLPPQHGSTASCSTSVISSLGRRAGDGRQSTRNAHTDKTHEGPRKEEDELSFTVRDGFHPVRGRDERPLHPALWQARNSKSSAHICKSPCAESPWACVHVLCHVAGAK